MAKKFTLVLTDFCEWLEDAGYLDDDWRREEPKAINEYLRQRKLVPK
jgi:hypothetical protein